MSNSFDDKIKESLENFEMPYDANAWTEFEKQLPQGGGSAISSSQFGWKATALVAALAVSVATIWYLNADKDVATSELAATEQLETAEQQSTTVEENSSKLPEAVVANESTIFSSTEKVQIADSKIVIEDEVASRIEPQTKYPEEAKTSNNSDVPNAEKKAVPPANNSTPEKIDAKPLLARFIPSSIKVCVGEEVNFINESSDLKAKMIWDFGDGTSSQELNPSHFFVAEGNFEVKLRTEKGSKSADRMISVTVNPVPVADIDASLVKNGFGAIPFYRFETVLKLNETAFWSFTDGSKAQTPVVKHLFRDAGKQEVTLTIKNSLGCSNSDQWETENRKAFQLLAPTGFRPDGDGNNEVFIPGALADMDVPFEMIIQDNKGQEVYRTSSSSEPWNGKVNNNGRKLDAGIYVWSVVLKEEIVTKKTFSGTITLLR